MNGRRERERGARPPYRPAARPGRHVGAIVAFLARFQSFSVIYFSFASLSSVRGPRARWSSALALSPLYLSLFLSHLAADAKFFKETKPAQAS